jgi:tetratricopeptide (TPR) repeat protein
MNDLTIGLLGALLATNQPQAVSNLVQQQTGVAIAVTADPAEKELRELMMADDDAEDEVDKWIRENDAFAAQGAGVSKEELNKRIRARLDTVRQGYEHFLHRHPDSARGYLAYGSFLNDIGDEEAASEQYEKSRQLDPKNPAVWNNLANYYGEHSPITNAFIYYTKAIELNPAEPVYYQNFATTVYLYRKDAREFYGINEQQVFDKALALYRQAMKLAPDNFVLATDYAESYYGIRPYRTNDALASWTNALNVAHNDGEREGAELHLARWKTSFGRFDEARAHLATVTNSFYADMRRRLERNVAEKENPATATNTMETSTNVVTAPANSAAASTNTP